jgi:hypothetical protein
VEVVAVWAVVAECPAVEVVVLCPAVEVVVVCPVVVVVCPAELVDGP